MVRKMSLTYFPKLYIFLKSFQGHHLKMMQKIKKKKKLFCFCKIVTIQKVWGSSFFFLNTSFIRMTLRIM